MKKFVRAAAVALSLCMSAGLFACGEKNVPGGGEETMGEKVSVYEKDGLTAIFPRRILSTRGKTFPN